MEDILKAAKRYWTIRLEILKADCDSWNRLIDKIIEVEQDVEEMEQQAAEGWPIGRREDLAPRRDEVVRLLVKESLSFEKLHPEQRSLTAAVAYGERCHRDKVLTCKQHEELKSIAKVLETRRNATKDPQQEDACQKQDDSVVGTSD